MRRARPGARSARGAPRGTHNSLTEVLTRRRQRRSVSSSSEYRCSSQACVLPNMSAAGGPKGAPYAHPSAVSARANVAGRSPPEPPPVPRREPGCRFRPAGRLRRPGPSREPARCDDQQCSRRPGGATGSVHRRAQAGHRRRVPGHARCHQERLPARAPGPGRDAHASDSPEQARPLAGPRRVGRRSVHLAGVAAAERQVLGWLAGDRPGRAQRLPGQLGRLPGRQRAAEQGHPDQGGRPDNSGVQDPRAHGQLPQRRVGPVLRHPQGRHDPDRAVQADQPGRWPGARRRGLRRALGRTATPGQAHRAAGDRRQRPPAGAALGRCRHGLRRAAPGSQGSWW